jgi:TIGR03009 family protein
MARESLASLVFGTAITALFFVNALPALAQVAAPQADAGDEAKQTAQLDQILQDWFDKSKTVKRLEGEHVRIIYNYVFGVASRAKGRFYYEAPDKGRIDLVPDPKGEGKTFEKVNPHNNKKVTLTAQPDQPERWICDGLQVLVIDEAQKVAQQYPLPPAARGHNIMDGPLPFLFGMPPEKAKQRYTMKVLQVTAKDIDLVVYPRWKQDSANYKWARIRIERATMLPMAVQMLDPPGSQETVYTFPRIEKNAKKGLLPSFFPWREKDPFKPDLSDYDIQAAQINPEKVAEAKPAAGPKRKQLVPSVVGFDFKEAQAILQKSGYTVKMLRGEPASSDKLIYRVQRQTPVPKTVVESGSVVALTLYVPPVEQASGETPVARSITSPKVVGIHWKDAEKVLRGTGLEVKFRQGRVAATTGDVFNVYDQQPAAGTAMKKGDTIILTLFIRPDMAKK